MGRAHGSFVFPICARLGTIPVILAGGATGCGGGEAPVGIIVEAALNANGLAPESLAPGAGGLDLRALGDRALAPGALDPAAAAAIQDPGAAGDLARRLLRYAAGCALTPAQSVEFAWTGLDGAAHAESWHGVLGLASAWAAQPLDPAGRQWVTACLASRVNALGITVPLSSRGTHAALGSTLAERTSYATREGAFFGDLFAEAPQVHACFDPLSMAPSQMAHRVCAQPDYLALNLNDLAGGYDCGPVHVIGPCEGVLGLGLVGPCTREDLAAHYFDGCTPPGGAGPLPAVTTFLQGAIPW